MQEMDDLLLAVVSSHRLRVVPGYLAAVSVGCERGGLAVTLLPGGSGPGEAV